MIKLNNLIPDKIIKHQNISNISVSGISCDSRKIKKNYIFAALVGVSKNGLDYINEAINNGAIVIITDNNNIKKLKYDDIQIISHKYPRKLYARICNKFSKYKFKNIVGITGTNGKTSVAWYVHQFSKLLNLYLENLLQILAYNFLGYL